MIRTAHIPPTASTSCPRKSGQALLESFGIIMLLCLILFGMVQYVLMLTATEVIQYSADASARARAVGFNDFMVRKVANITTIPNAGALRNYSGPRSSLDNWNQTHTAGSAFTRSYRSNPSSSQYATYEQYAIPLYLGSMNESQALGYLDYEDWETVTPPVYLTSSGDTVSVQIRQEYELRMPLFRAFSSQENIDIRKEAVLADHAELYLE